jgi:Domain of unknown function (DUF4349)
MEPYREDADLAAALQGLRPQPSPAFAAALDERAAARFPRRPPLGDARLGDLLARLQALPPRRLLLSAGATALTAIVVATAVVAVSEPGSQSSPSRFAETSAANAGAGSGHATGTTLQNFDRGSADTISPQSPTAAPSASRGFASEGAPASAKSAARAESLASDAGHRDIERSAEMVLGAEPSEVAGDAAKVFEAVHASHGIVLSSSIDGGSAGHAGARFQLLIPSAKLSDALAAFSGIAEVRSRHDATADITAPTVRVGEQLQDSKARVDSLLVQLAGAETESEQAEVEAELSAERHHAASLRSHLAKLDRRASLSHVSLRIETGKGPSSAGGSSAWGPGDALGSAADILGIAAGVAIVGLAVLGPILLIALLAWLAHRTWLRRGRDRALS